jgi:hypothetical protein
MALRESFSRTPQVVDQFARMLRAISFGDLNPEFELEPVPAKVRSQPNYLLRQSTH